MATVIVTAHAAQRYVERINPSLTAREARLAIRQHHVIINKAADIGCHVVKLGCGARLVLDGVTVITVLEKGWLAHAPELAAA